MTMSTDHSRDEIVAQIKDEIDLNNYDYKGIVEGRHYWAIKPSLFEGEAFCDFLRTQYKAFGYANATTEEMIEKLKKAKGKEEFMRLVEENEVGDCYLLQHERCYVGGIAISYPMISLFSEGKFLMEEYQGTLAYAQHMARLQRDKYPIADCLCYTIY